VQSVGLAFPFINFACTPETIKYIFLGQPEIDEKRFNVGL